MGHARALLALPTVSEQLRLRDEILTHDWSVRTTEDSIRAKESLAEARGLAPRKGRRRSVELAALEEALQRGLMTRVRIIGHARKGKSEVSSATPDELERLAEIFGAFHQIAAGKREHAHEVATRREMAIVCRSAERGVDSSVAASLLVRQGCDVVGITMRVWPRQETDEPTKRFGSCCGTEAVEDARQVARTLGIPHYLLSMDEEFNQKVIDQFVDSYGKGQTPIPGLS
jgi:hypothetical protein